MVILALHPLFGVGIIIWMYKQYSYKKSRQELRGEMAKKARTSHEHSGLQIYRFALASTILGIFINARIGYFAGEGIIGLFPSGLHGWFGILGIVLLTFTINKGKLVKKQRQERVSFALNLKRHSRSSDIIMILIVFHAFLGFIYLFKLIV